MKSSFERIYQLFVADPSFQDLNFTKTLTKLSAKFFMRRLKCMMTNVNLGCVKIEIDAIEDTFIMGMDSLK